MRNLRLIKENVLALATTDRKRNPHCVAVTDVVVVLKNKILATDNYMEGMFGNTEKNNNVSLMFWSKD